MHNVILSEAKDLLEDNMQGHYYVYMMGSASGRALYVGVTNDLQRRVLEHKNGETAGLQAVIGVMPYFITSLIRTFEMQ